MGLVMLDLAGTLACGEMRVAGGALYGRTSSRACCRLTSRNQVTLHHRRADPGCAGDIPAGPGWHGWPVWSSFVAADIDDALVNDDALQAWSCAANCLQYEARSRRVPGARGKAAGALSTAGGVLRDSAIESAKDGIDKLSDKIGKMASAGLAALAAHTMDSAGHHSPWVVAGAASVGYAAGPVVRKVATTTLDRVTSGWSGPVRAVVADLTRVLRLLEEAAKGVAEAIDAVNQAQAYFQQVSKGANSNLVRSATRRCGQAPDRLRAGLADLSVAQNLVGNHLVTVARTGKK